MTNSNHSADHDEDDEPGAHPDHETPILTDAGPMSVTDALSHPAAFVEMTVETKTYCTFLPFPPAIMATMLKDVDGGSSARVEPFSHGGKCGSLVTTPNEELHVRIGDRFGTCK